MLVRTALLSSALFADARNHVNSDASGDTESSGLVERWQVVNGPLDDLGRVSFAEFAVDVGEVVDDMTDLCILLGLFRGLCDLL